LSRRPHVSKSLTFLGSASGSICSKVH
jgi:hypothetical protein